MGRYAVFVDAGYLLAIGAQSCTGKPSRSFVRCDHIALVRAVMAAVPAPTGDHLLRTYWYDGADRTVPTRDQLTVARLPDLKLRLGRLIGNRQKGVDSLIVRDLMTLARERAITTAYLLSGDEDVREGVADAQDVGVRVVLLGLEGFETTQAETLINEADGRVVLPAETWKPFFAPLGLAASTAVVAAASSTTVVVAAPAPSAPVTPTASSPDAAGRIRDAAQSYGRNWAKQADEGVMRTLLGGAPKIPSHMDAELLFYSLDTSGLSKTQLSYDLKKVLRAAFWDGVREVTSAEKKEVLANEGSAPDG